MKHKTSNIIQSKSEIPYNYATIKITQSRIDKGLIAIPMALADWFPGHNSAIQIYLNNPPAPQMKRYSSYSSSTRECRIGGLRQWFEENNIQSGDEAVIQLIDKERFIYRLIPERNFILKTEELEYSFDNSETIEKATEKIMSLSNWTCLDKNKVALNEYYRLVNAAPPTDRQYVRKNPIRAKEIAPPNLRILVGNIYKRHCQICDFFFLKRDKGAYFEIHHLDPMKGHHPKNLIVVCGNCHNQFEYADVKQYFSDDGWLVKVSFNENIFSIQQAISITRIKGFSKELFV